MSESGLTDAARKSRAEYYKEWRRKNPGKQREYIERYWQRRYEKLNSEQAPDGEKTESE